jgi:NAD-dependent DNA ligase
VYAMEYFDIDQNGNVILNVPEYGIKTIREGKGKHLIQFPENYVFIHIKTTGMDPNFNQIIEIRAIRYERGQAVRFFSELVEFDKNVIEDFDKFLGDSIIVGYNINFEIDFLYDSFMDNLNKTLSNDFIDITQYYKISYDEEELFRGKMFVFTGTLEKMVRRDAMKIVHSLGGETSNSLTVKTNYLVLGRSAYYPLMNSGKSSKHRKADTLIKKGIDIKIILEMDFYKMIENSSKK